MTRVVPANVRRQPPLHHFAELFRLVDSHDQMEMIRHDAERVQMHVVPLPRLLEKVNEPVVLRRRMKHLRAIVPSAQDVSHATAP
jgi:hypothetical protein